MACQGLSSADDGEPLRISSPAERQPHLPGKDSLQLQCGAGLEGDHTGCCRANEPEAIGKAQGLLGGSCNPLTP